MAITRSRFYIPGPATVAAPGSGIALTVNGVNNSYTEKIIGGSGNSFGLWITAGTGGGDTAIVVQNLAGSISFFAIDGDGHGNLGPTATTGFTWTTGGAFTLAAPTSGDALSVSNVSGANALTVNGNAAGTAVVRLNTQGTTGAQTASFSATNKPGAASGSPQSWLPVSIDGTTRYIPCFS